MDNHDFDIAVSFAGEDRAFVEQVVLRVKAAGYRVFYDEDYQHEMWGEELTEFFPDVYERRSRYVVMFISKHYAAKAWTRVERRSVLARAMNLEAAYLLPVRLDSTALPGVRNSIGYLDGLRFQPAGIADAIQGKLGGPQSDETRQFNGLAPRTLVEKSILVGERPSGWEYLLFAYHLTEFIDREAVRYADNQLGFTIPNGYVADADVMYLITREKAHLLADMDLLEALLLGPAQEDAMGAPGAPGDPKKIEHLAERIMLIYSDLLGWAAGLRGLAAESDESRNLLRAFSDNANQPIVAIHEFVPRYRELADGLSSKLAAGESISIQMPIEFEIPDPVADAVSAASEAFRAHMKKHSR